MTFFSFLFASPRRHRRFALLDAEGRCRAFKECQQPPVGDGWVEIEEIRLTWLNQPLPASARVSPRVSRARGDHPLAA